MEDNINKFIDNEKAFFPLYKKSKVLNLIFKNEKTKKKIFDEGELDDKKKISNDLEK